MPRYRRWCWTSFLTKEHFTSLSLDNVIWLIAGTETCPDTNRLHVQGAIIFQNARTMAAVKTTLGDPAIHLERMNGTPQQSLAYCTKEDSDAFTAGVIPAQVCLLHPFLLV